MRRTLPRSFYLRADVVNVARELLGMVLTTDMDGVATSGIITETEAYAGAVDQASHAYMGRRTDRNEPMYSRGGTAYVYLCYGIHHLFNVVTNKTDIPHAVLIRAVVPLDREVTMLERRAGRPSTDGPGKVSMALGICTAHSGTDLIEGPIRLEDRGIRVAPNDVLTGPRIGVEYAGSDALLPYRFRVAPSRLRR